jgi:hypothetical protein
MDLLLLLNDATALPPDITDDGGVVAEVDARHIGPQANPQAATVGQVYHIGHIG